MADLTALADDALAIIEDAVTEHQPSHVFALFSGGHDSLCSTHVASQHPAFTGVAHINTGIGIEATRTFVRATCERNGWDLTELRPDAKTYDEMVLEQGFPSGPKSHNTMYYWLKQRQVRRLVREHKTGRHDRIGLVTGIRLQESDRRMAGALSVEVRRDGAQLWISPILHWSKLDLNAYIRAAGLTRNEVSDHLHRSGECLCGALAHRDEIRAIEMFYPDAAARIHRLEAQCREAGLVDCRWAAPPKGPGMTHDDLAEQTGQPSLMPLCVGCDGRDGRG